VGQIIEQNHSENRGKTCQQTFYDALTTNICMKAIVDEY